MQANKLLETSPLTIADLAAAEEVPGPAITIAMPVAPGGGAVRTNPVLLAQSMREVHRRLAEREMPQSKITELLEPIQGLSGYLQSGDQLQGQGLAVFRNRDLFRCVWTTDPLPEKTVIARHFYIRPLLPAFTQDRTFYILALSQKRIRLLLSNDRGAEEVPLPPGTPESLHTYEGLSKPDHVLDNRSSAGPASGSSKGIVFGTGTDREDTDEYLAHFYRAVDKGLATLLRESRKPLLLAGVEYEIPIFKRATTYDDLAGAVVGAPDGLKGGELHKRALECMADYWQRPVEEAVAQFDKHYGAGRATSNVKEIVKAAFDGRVSHLIVAQNSDVMGEFHEATHQVSTHKSPVEGEEDLVNAAALWSLLKSGQVFITSRNKVPHGSHMAALLRY